MKRIVVRQWDCLLLHARPCVQSGKEKSEENYSGEKLLSNHDLHPHLVKFFKKLENVGAARLGRSHRLIYGTNCSSVGSGGGLTGGGGCTRRMPQTPLSNWELWCVRYRKSPVTWNGPPAPPEGMMSK